MLCIKEIFESIQGEGEVVGMPSIFVRLAGCNLKCDYCDSKYSWDGGKDMNEISVLEAVNTCRRAANGRHILTLTGGEPLVQPITELLKRLKTHLGMKIVVETNGTINPKSIYDNYVWKWSVSPKLSSSEVENYRYKFKNRKNAYYKFVVLNKDDLDEISVKYMFEEDVGKEQIILQPNGQREDYIEAVRELIAWNEDYGFRIIPQIHRMIFDELRGV